RGVRDERLLQYVRALRRVARRSHIRLCSGPCRGDPTVKIVRVMTERQLCARFARPSLTRALWQLGNTLPMFVLLWSVMAWSIQADWGHGCALLLALPAAGLYVRLF